MRCERNRTLRGRDDAPTDQASCLVTELSCMLMRLAGLWVPWNRADQGRGVAQARATTCSFAELGSLPMEGLHFAIDAPLEVEHATYEGVRLFSVGSA